MHRTDMLSQTYFCLYITFPVSRQDTSADIRTGTQYNSDEDALLRCLQATATCGLQQGMRDDTHAYVCSYYDSIDRAGEAEKALQREGVSYPYTISKVPAQDWNSKWYESIEPIKLTSRIWVSPVWRAPEKKPDEAWIRIEPKMAFGTGYHQTTRLVVQALQAYTSDVRDAVILDVGTGTGILCFAASIFGAARCVGCEIDMDSLESIQENMHHNRAHGEVAMYIGTVDALQARARFRVVVMNVLFMHSRHLLPGILPHLQSGGMCMWSGILVEERQRVLSCARSHDLYLEKEWEEDEWWCGAFRYEVPAS
jgi:ribosomal protein L11 methyltransferase